MCNWLAPSFAALLPDVHRLSPSFTALLVFLEGRGFAEDFGRRGCMLLSVTTQSSSRTDLQRIVFVFLGFLRLRAVSVLE